MVWSPTFRQDIEERFRSHCECNYVNVDLFGNSLETFIQDWFHKDFKWAIKLTGGDYSAWLEAVIIIIDAYEKDHSILDFEGNEIVPEPRTHRVDRIFNLEVWGVAFLDRHIYQKYAAGGI